MAEESFESDNTITLRLRNYDITVDREKLSQVSRYFAALFSHNFKDSMEKVHVINFDIDPKTLKTFIDWIHDGEIVKPPWNVKSSLIAAASEDITQLLDLLKLCDLYAVDQLVDDIIGTLATKWLQPEKVIDIWMLAQEMRLNVLQDLCVAMCLDRFEELPIDSLTQLTKQNILQLIESKCIRASQDYVNRISITWSRCHGEPLTIHPDNNNRPIFMQCKVGYKIDKFSNRKAYIYCWDGTKLSQLLEVKDCERACVKKEIVGIGATGRGSSVYVVGGERGFGTGNFNMEIWRYCFISQRWYYQARSPTGRRHMVVAFLDNQLAIVGGTGRHRLKLNSVDILDIHTGHWRKVANVPENFSEVPPHCVRKGKLFLLQYYVYIYDPVLDNWQTVKLPDHAFALTADVFTVYGNTFFFTYSDDKSAETKLFSISSTQTPSCSEKISYKNLNQVKTTSFTVFKGCPELCQLKFACVAGINILFLSNNNYRWKDTYLNLHDEEIDDLHENCINSKLGCFELINHNILCGRAP